MRVDKMWVASRTVVSGIALGGIALVSGTVGAQRGDVRVPSRDAVTAVPLPLPVLVATVCPTVPADARSVTAVTATVRNPRVETTEAQTDCGDGVFNVGADHHLEAGRVTTSGVAHETFPERAQYCGKIVRYGVNNEFGPARDIMFNMTPLPGYEHFVKGFISTECASIGDIVGGDACAKGDAKCSAECTTLANQTRVRMKNGEERTKCIHAEITPPEQFFEADSRYMPVPDTGEHSSKWDLPTALVSVPKVDGVEACVYGVYAIDHGESHGAKAHKDWRCTLDKTHDRPEIHPFDATWWRIPSKPKAKYKRDGWVMAVFQDDSNRYSYPHCTDDHNGSSWAQAPRDVTFRFPFRFDHSDKPKHACLRHVRAPKYAKKCTPRPGSTPSCVWSATGPDVEIVPLNVTTLAATSATAELKTLTAPDGRAALVVDEPADFDTETHVTVDGCVQGNQATGFITLRVAVGCNDTAHGASNPKMACAKADLARYNPRGRHDSGDSGSGFYYAELFFSDKECP